MKLSVRHRTEYVYDAPMRSVIQSLRLWPTEFEGQDVKNWSVRIEGHEAERGAAFRDGAGDWVETVSMRDVSAATIMVEGEIETRDLTGVVRGLREKVTPVAYLRATPMTRLDAALRELAADAVRGADSQLDKAHAISHAIRSAIVYTTGATESETTAAEALKLGQGVCQDQTHAIIAAARAVGMPGRYTIGYLHSTEDATVHQASHAWAEIWVEGLGWVGFDAANGCCPDDRYIRLGCGLDARSAAPIRGRALGAGTEDMHVEVEVVQAQQ
ncbi:Transglutaminase-like enzyme, putative cysteine protease [Palleronia marisminoris]|uniref:Transglutaminase-like superfamily protein n=1 Tax=Palleronia marisminoris TaxID=315423 RepID=A0A1Y5REB7_9RHOB|nr:transglutaminase family protein [Palleronia marisminoris]SFG14519.1 Transglutaminase-like enzyme, putative cysteine protease [Palleronia marisminoris]SLN15249.1 Transglutaminase-like superfamily protein [Palleronia marisminoris]